MTDYDSLWQFITVYDTCSTSTVYALDNMGWHLTKRFITVWKVCESYLKKSKTTKSGKDLSKSDCRYFPMKLFYSFLETTGKFTSSLICTKHFVVWLSVLGIRKNTKLYKICMTLTSLTYALYPVPNIQILPNNILTKISHERSHIHDMYVIECITHICSFNIIAMSPPSLQVKALYNKAWFLATHYYGA